MISKSRVRFRVVFVGMIFCLCAIAFGASVPGLATAATVPTYSCGSYGGGSYDSCDSTSNSASSQLPSGNTTTPTTANAVDTGGSPEPLRPTANETTQKSDIGRSARGRSLLFYFSLLVLAVAIAAVALLATKRHRHGRKLDQLS